MCPTDDDVLRVLLEQRRQAETLERAQTEHTKVANEAIANTEALLRRAGVTPPQRGGPSTRLQAGSAPPKLRSWAELAAEANSGAVEQVSFADLLTADEVRSVIDDHRALEAEFTALHELDAFDWAVSGVAGVLGALVDIFLVQVPKHPGFLGSTGREGGWLSKAVKEGVGRVLPEEKIRSLEGAYRVPYDASTSHGLDTAVPGLGPGTHRFQSLGHDPVLGWIFGVRDLLAGEFTAIGSDGRLIVQTVASPFLAGERFYLRLFEALRVVGGHMVSDVATARGLPAPLMPLLLFVQQGTIGKHGYSVGEVTRQMYRMGYDFRHFLASSLPVLIIEGIVRIAFFAKAISEGRSLAEAVPIASTPKLRTQLFIAHSVATAANAGKVYVTSNPLGVNWPQWLTFFRYLLPQLHWLLVGMRAEQARHVQAHIDDAWKTLDVENAVLWRKVFGDGEQAVL